MPVSIYKVEKLQHCTNRLDNDAYSLQKLENCAMTLKQRSTREPQNQTA